MPVDYNMTNRKDIDVYKNHGAPVTFRLLLSVSFATLFFLILLSSSSSSSISSISSSEAELEEEEEEEMASESPLAIPSAQFALALYDILRAETGKP